MNETTAFNSVFPEEQVDVEVAAFREQFEGANLLDQVVRRGAQQILQQAIETEVEKFLQQHLGRQDGNGNRVVVRNGHQAARKTKGNGTRKASLAMMFKLAQAAQKKWQRLHGSERLSLVIQGRVFVDGELQDAA